MRENKLRSLWAAGKPAVNGWLAIPNSFAAEVMAHQGWDTLTIDMQHGLDRRSAGADAAGHSVHADHAGRARALAGARRSIMKTLDAGAQAIICPMVNTREDAQKPGVLHTLRAAGRPQLRAGARRA